MTKHPEHIKATLDRARHDPDAYRELRYDDFSRRPSKQRTAPGVATHAWSEAPLPKGPASLFALGEETVRTKVKSPRLLHAALGWDGGSLVLCGETGVGKTAALVLLCMVKAPEGWRWVDGYALGQCARRSALGTGEPELIGMASRAKVLIVDDPDHAIDREPFIEVMRHRYDEQLPTLIATGKRYSELETHFGDAYIRRVEESGTSCTVVDLWDAGKQP